MLYAFKVKLLKNKRINYIWRYWHARRGVHVGEYKHLPDYVRKYAPGKSFADIGCMWGVNGEYGFIAEEAGATTVKCVDVFGPTPEFEEKKKALNSNLEFILGDITQTETIKRIGKVDVVLCAGVLYHHPSPFDVLVSLRKICSQTLILRTFTIPENKWLANTAVFFPMLKKNDRKLWNLQSLGVGWQEGITDEFNRNKGYSNWFWGFTPSCVISLLETVGFHVDHRATEPFAQNIICSVESKPFEHSLPTEEEARKMGEEISAAGTAHPA